MAPPKKETPGVLPTATPVVEDARVVSRVEAADGREAKPLDPRDARQPMPNVGQAPAPLVRGTNEVAYANQTKAGEVQAYVDAQNATLENERRLQVPKPIRWKTVGIERIPGQGSVNWHESTYETAADGTVTVIEQKLVKKMAKGEALERIMLNNMAVMTALA